MDYQYVPPPAPTIARWKNLYTKHPGLSSLRALEYEAIEQLTIDGDVLDYGGGGNALYLHLLGEVSDLKSANIDPDIDPTDIVEPGQPLPYDTGIFDHVVCFNTLEHIYDAYASVEEIQRVLKPGGRAIITVPFIFRIHGHPDDYIRATPSWWRETCQRIGFSRLELQPLVWGRYTAAGSVSGARGLFPRFQFHLQHFKDWLYAKVAVRQSDYSGKRGDRICAVSPGWLLVATK